MDYLQNTMINKRVPVLSSDGQPLMPTKASRARRWLKEGKAKVTTFDFLMVSRLGNRPRKMHDLTIKAGGRRDSYGGFESTHPYRNGDKVEYCTKKLRLIGIVSACDLYQIFPKRQRLKQGITAKNTRLISRNCNLLVNHIRKRRIIDEA